MEQDLAFIREQRNQLEKTVKNLWMIMDLMRILETGVDYSEPIYSVA